MIVPAGVMRPIFAGLALRVNQTFPSGPAVIPFGKFGGFGTGNSVTTPAGVMRPIL